MSASPFPRDPPAAACRRLPLRGGPRSVPGPSVQRRGVTAGPARGRGAGAAAAPREERDRPALTGLRAGPLRDRSRGHSAAPRFRFRAAPPRPPMAAPAPRAASRACLGGGAAAPWRPGGELPAPVPPRQPGLLPAGKGPSAARDPCAARRSVCCGGLRVPCAASCAAAQRAGLPAPRDSVSAVRHGHGITDSV